MSINSIGEDQIDTVEIAMRTHKREWLDLIKNAEDKASSELTEERNRNNDRARGARDLDHRLLVY